MRKGLFSIITALSVGGCGDSPKRKEAPTSVGESKDRELIQRERHELISYFTSKVADPDSLEFRFPPLLSNKYRSGYSDDYCFYFNAKNKYGGYVGYRPAMVHVKQDSEGVTGFGNISTAISANAAIVDLENNLCKSYGYEITMAPSPQSDR